MDMMASPFGGVLYPSFAMFFAQNSSDFNGRNCNFNFLNCNVRVPFAGRKIPMDARNDDMLEEMQQSKFPPKKLIMPFRLPSEPKEGLLMKMKIEVS